MTNKIIEYLRSVNLEQLVKDWEIANAPNMHSINAWLDRLKEAYNCGSDEYQEYAYEVWSCATEYIADKIKNENFKFNDDDMEFLAEVKREVKNTLSSDYKLFKSYFPKASKNFFKIYDFAYYELN